MSQQVSVLSDSARKAMDAYFSTLFKNLGQPENSDRTKYYAVTPPMETAIRKTLQESLDFLQFITMKDVDQMSGQVVDVGASRLHTGRSATGRFHRNIGVSGNVYTLAKTDSAVDLDWETLSNWANSGDVNEFMTLVNAFTMQAFALDILRIGFNGISVAATTDPDANPLGQDVNKGWHQLAKEFNGGSQIITDPVTIGPSGDYKSLDAAAADIINTKIPQEFRNDPRLTIMVGADLVAAEQFRLYGKADKPTEKIAAQLLADSVAGRSSAIPPFMPGKRLAVTIPANLQVLTQRNTRQRKVEFVEDRAQYENKYLRNEGYALGYRELYGAIDESAVTIVGEEAVTPPAGG
ncbi:phage major capsid protein%2C P2 family [Serratia marcescens]|uniref:phage major capsid protein, P2 family n=1 Tax=Serratia marcescens TaxID=615 RepID=UPI0007452A13|nr:phage major capsid protein%2C P2 family [Serratia marcescens]